MIKPTLSAHKLIHIQITLALCSSSLGLQFYMWTFFLRRGGEFILQWKRVENSDTRRTIRLFPFYDWVFVKCKFCSSPLPHFGFRTQLLHCLLRDPLRCNCNWCFYTTEWEGERLYQRKLKGTKILRSQKLNELF